MEESKHVQLHSGASCLKFDMGFHHFPNIVHACSEGSGETAHVRRLA